MLAVYSLGRGVSVNIHKIPRLILVAAFAEFAAAIALAVKPVLFRKPQAAQIAAALFKIRIQPMHGFADGKLFAYAVDKRGVFQRAYSKRCSEVVAAQLFRGFGCLGKS